MLPELPQISFSMPSWLQSFPPEISSLVPAERSAGVWLVVGAVVALLSLWALRRARRTVVAAVIGVVGVLLAWNSGFLPLAS